MADQDLFERALRAPQREFPSPEAVARSDQLRPEQRRAVLERWREDAGRTAADEGGLLTRIGRALAFLDTETGAHEADHDQGFYTSVSDIRKD